MKYRACACLFLLVACDGGEVMVDAGRVDPDGGRSTFDAGMERVPCGPTTCAAAEVCCNESCGICTLPGEGCSPQSCDDAGTDAGMAPRFGGACGGETCALGFICCPGCGADEACAEGEICPAVTCEDPCGGACDDGEYCDYDADTCGGGEGACAPRPDECTDDCPGVCGCDGEDYCNACDAAAAGVDVAYEGECGGGECGAMDAEGRGECSGTVVGIAWDGSSCIKIGCECVGADCDYLYEEGEQ
jgi:hypothetical protein